MKQCADCETFKKGDNCIRCAMQYKEEASEAKEVAEKADGALNEIANVFGKGKNDNSKIILIEGILQAYNGKK